MKRLRLTTISMCLVLAMILLTIGVSCSQQSSTSTATQTISQTQAQVQASSTPSATTSATLTPQYGGDLKIIVPDTVTSFGYPPEMAPPGDIYSQPCLQALVYFNDTTGEFGPMLATSWNVAPDGKSVTLTLRQGVKFQDGTDFNADAAKYNLDLTRQSNGALHDITSIDVIDPYTIRLNLDQYNNLLPLYLGTYMGKMISPTALQKNGKDWASTHPVGTGPYEFNSFQRDVYLKYTRFNGYWGGKPYLDSMEYDFKADVPTALAAFESGGGQILMDVSPADAVSLKAKGYNVVFTHSTENFLAPSSQNPQSPFANLKVREAVEYAIDKAAIVKGPGYGYWQATYGIVPPGSVGFNSSLAPRTYDPAKAKQLLAEAGYPNGFNTTLYVRPPVEDSVVPIVTYLKNVGINATLQQVTFTSWVSMSTKGWDGLLFAFTGIDPNVLNRFQGDLGVPQGQYISTTRPTGFQSTLDAATAATDLQSRTQLTEEFDKLIYDNETFIPLYHDAQIAAYNSTVQNCDLNKYHFVYWHPSQVWLSK